MIEVSDDVHIDAQISFRHFVATLPHWVLRSKTKFSAFLAKSFHVHPSGICHSTAVFPLPVPHFGIFSAQQSPKIGAKKWKQLGLQRLLRIIVMALNYIHGNMHLPPVALLGPTWHKWPCFAI